MKKNYYVLFLLFTSTMSFSQEGILPVTPSAENYTPRPYVGLQVGSLGAGLQFAYPLHKQWDLRVGGTFMPQLSTKFDGKQDGADVANDYRFKSASASLIADYAFIKNKPGIKLAFGAVYNGTVINGIKTYYEPTFDKDLGVLSLEVTPGMAVNPYVGFVFGNFKKSKTVFFVFEIGAMYMGKPQVSFTGEGRVGPTANESNQAIIANNLKGLQIYPYGNLQLNFNVTKKK